MDENSLFEPVREDDEVQINTLSIDEKTGNVTINGKVHRMCDLSFEKHEDKKELRFIIKAQIRDADSLSVSGEERYYLTDTKKFLVGYREKGLLAAELEEKHPKLVDKSRELLIHDEVYSLLDKGILPHLDPPDGVLLKKNEFVIMVDSTSDFCQERVKTEVYGGSTSIRVAKGVSFRVGKATPVKTEYLAVLDSGRLVLTNKQLIFKGARKSATIPLTKVVDLTTYSDGVGIVKDGVQKMYIFTKIDGNMWSRLISEAVAQLE